MGIDERHVMGKLTAASVRGMKKPGKYYDQHGLILRVAPGGSKQWIWRGTVRGRRRDIGLGAFEYTDPGRGSRHRLPVPPSWPGAGATPGR